ncbi:MAG: AAA family ATPase [Candidatus Nanopelagicales bacterium]|nr:AAA family ATPase [Candidatus Nanopelagicales bacterium]MDZ4250659.1 AAA family ATPase [Candidatus Nanopelagicales bacterium]MDZ7578205.1 AAA family ATPase [Candidatus Nanopelagicales bacterium]
MGTTTQRDVVALIRAAPALLGRTKLVTVDGPAGAGKSSFAAALASELPDSEVIHMDDLYEGWEGLDDRLSERVDAWILTPLRSGLPAQHLVYDWARGVFGSWRVTTPPGVLILEGVGSLQAHTSPVAALRIWLEAPRETLNNRLTSRDGAISGHLTRWKIREAEFFERLGSRGLADLVLDTSASS